ncbi:DinB family protein [Winogradskyella psychrotolerans]|uniref:DinB family protein n=1 Tax=Winogradskyella psychrotolerans TaxID=1344585 RepID=UPI001C0768DA|nr:DinB family protein [Winogradskyella psychrotolerans]MBU2929970.1 DinB family protein [Winogradskyella psychrotolerans]
MLTDTLLKLFKRDINKLIDEINLYKHEPNIWKVDGIVTNSTGNLCLHLIANLNHFIGAILGDSGYVRQRELEFSLKDVPKSELIKQLENTLISVERTIKSLSLNDLQSEYKLHVFGEPMTTEYFLVHLNSHLAYHLGQINYHRRLLDK